MRVVSLGKNCQPSAQARRRFGIEEAYFFDSVISDAAAVTRLILQEFLWRFDETVLRFHPESNAIRHEPTGLYIVHDLPVQEDFAEAIPAARSKFEYLGRRMRELFAAREPVLFVAHEYSRGELAQVEAVIASKHPQLPFHILQTSAAGLPMRPGPRVTVAEVGVVEREDGDDWRGSDADWDKAFDRALAESGYAGEPVRTGVHEAVTATYSIAAEPAETPAA